MTGVLVRGLATAVLFLGLVALRISEHYPSLPSPLTCELQLEPGVTGRADPLIVSGRIGEGDFLSARFESEHSFRFAYDSWGVPALLSQPVNFSPGTRLRLRIEMPALDRVQGGRTPWSDHVRITCEGATVLDSAAHCYPRAPNAIFFGENPLGGTACGPGLHGRLFATDGRELRGSPQKIANLPARLADWLTQFPGQLAALFVFSVLLVFAATRFGPAAEVARRTIDVVVHHRWFIGCTAVAVVIYAWLVTLGTFRFNYAEIFGSFYDYQAASLLEGRLDVPEVAIGGEAFESRGKLYGYFGPTPALLRLPFVIFGFAFGRLSRAFMLLYFVASLIASYLILREACRCTSSATPANATSPPLEPSVFSIVTLVSSVGLGSTLFFVGSRGLIFHEAILGGITFALWSCWAGLRHLRAPGGRWWIGAFICGTLSLHTRPPTGLFALSFLGGVLLMLIARDGLRPLRRPMLIGTLCLVGVLSLNGLAWLKFRTFDAAPLRISRPYTEPGRLQYIEGKSFHAVNIPFNFYTYFIRPNFRIEAGFPWIYLGSPDPGRPFPKAKIDLADHTLAIPFAMPSLFGLATIGSLAAALALPGTRAAVLALWAGVVPMTLALFAAVATAQRYTGDFCPFLICAAAFGLAAAERAAGLRRTLLRVCIAGATVAAMAVTIAITLHYQGDYLWGVPEQTQREYQKLRQRADRFFGGQPIAQR